MTYAPEHRPSVRSLRMELITSLDAPHLHSAGMFWRERAELEIPEHVRAFSEQLPNVLRHLLEGRQCLPITYSEHLLRSDDPDCVNRGAASVRSQPTVDHETRRPHSWMFFAGALPHRW